MKFKTYAVLTALVAAFSVQVFAETIILELPMPDLGYVMSPSGILLDDGSVLLMACVGYYPLPGDPTPGFEALRVWTIREAGISWHDLNRSSHTGGLCETCLGSMVERDGSILITAVETYLRTPGQYDPRIAGLALYERTPAGVWIDYGLWGYHSDPACWNSPDDACFPMHPAMTVDPETNELYVYVEEEDRQIRYTVPTAPAPLNGSPLDVVEFPSGVHPMIEDAVAQLVNVDPQWAHLSEELVQFTAISAADYGRAEFFVMDSDLGLDQWSIVASYGDYLWGHSPSFLRTGDDGWGNPYVVLWTGTRDGGPPPPGYAVVIKAEAYAWGAAEILTRLDELPVLTNTPIRLRVHRKTPYRAEPWP